MRICYLADAQSTHTQKWVTHFASCGHDVHLISFRDADIPGIKFHPVKKTVPVLISPAASTLKKAGYFFYAGLIRRLIREIAPDLLHAHYATSYGLLGARANYHPFIISTWGKDILDFPNKSVLHKKLIQYTLKKADTVTATSKMLTLETKKLMPGEKPVITVPFGVNTDHFYPFSEKQKNRKVLTIGIVKNLEIKYGIDILLKAYAKIAEKHENTGLMIIGKGTEEQNLKQLTRKLGLTAQVQFIDYAPNKEIPAYLNRMDIFVMPSIDASETFGVAAIEASACGLPVVASQIGGLPEVVIDEQTGLLCKPGSWDDLASKLDRLIKNRELRKTLGKQGRLFVLKHYQWEKNALQMEKLYLQTKNGQSGF